MPRKKIVKLRFKAILGDIGASNPLKPPQNERRKLEGGRKSYRDCDQEMQSHLQSIKIKLENLENLMIRTEKQNQQLQKDKKKIKRISSPVSKPRGEFPGRVILEGVF